MTSVIDSSRRGSRENGFQLSVSSAHPSIETDAVNPLCYGAVIALTDDKPLRRDAARNRERILAAARELFGERGVGVSLNDLAHHAGVGVGTVYRHFPDKDALIQQLFEAQFAELVALGEQALADPDPWRGLTTWLSRALEMQLFNRALNELMHGSPGAEQRVSRVRARLLPMSAEIVRRAHATGQLRTDVTATDLPILQLLVATAFDGTDTGADPELWRRYLAVLLRGISTHPDELPPLPGTPPTPDELPLVMAAAKRRRHR